jgi:hypothetical protein
MYHVVLEYRYNLCAYIFFRVCYRSVEPATAAALSKAWTVFGRSDSEIVGFSPTQGIDVWCAYEFILCLCCRSGLATRWSIVQGVLQCVKKWLRNWIRGQGPECAGRGIEKNRSAESKILTSCASIIKRVRLQRDWNSGQQEYEAGILTTISWYCASFA